MHETIKEKAAAIIRDHSAQGSVQNPYCVLALTDLEGYPTASAITAARASGIERITFGTGLISDKAKRIEKNGRAGVCFAGPGYNLTLVGDIAISTDPDVKRENWYAGMANHFSGPEDPNFCVLMFTTRRYNLFVGPEEAQGTL